MTKRTASRTLHQRRRSRFKKSPPSAGCFSLELLFRTTSSSSSRCASSVRRDRLDRLLAFSLSFFEKKKSSHSNNHPRLVAFKNTFERPISDGGDPHATDEQRRLGKERAASLSTLTGSIVLRRLSTILADYLPPKRELVLVCRPTGAQIEIYKRCLSSQDVKDLLYGGSHSVSALSCLQKLVKICNHPALLLFQGSSDDGNDPQAADSIEDDGLGVSSILPDGFTAASTDPLVELSGKMVMLDGLSFLSFSSFFQAHNFFSNARRDPQKDH